MNRIFVLLLITLSFSAIAKGRKVRYLNTLYGSVHQNPSKSSTSLTVLSCGHPVRFISSQGKEWKKVKAGMHTGYVPSKFLQKRKPTCFQDKYPRYFESLNLSVTEYYFWARLYDNYISNSTDTSGR